MKEVCLPAELLRGVRVGVGNEREAVKRREPPVHRRIGGEAGFHRMDIRRHIAKARLHGIKAGECAKHRKMRRPDMRGNKNSLCTNIHRDF